MIFVTHPLRERLLAELAAFVADLREHGPEPATVAACVDWLIEQQTTLAEVVEAYALPPIEADRRRWYVDSRQMALGMTQARREGFDMSRTFRRSDPDEYGFITIDQAISPEQVAACQHADDTLRPVLATWLRCRGLPGDAERAAQVEVFRVGEYRGPSNQRLWTVLPQEWKTPHERDNHPDPDRARLALKRRVLALFGEVRYERRCVIDNCEVAQRGESAGWIQQRLQEAGFCVELRHWSFHNDRANGRWVYTQTLTPLQLLPPEEPIPGWQRVQGIVQQTIDQFATLGVSARRAGEDMSQLNDLLHQIQGQSANPFAPDTLPPSRPLTAAELHRLYGRTLPASPPDPPHR